MRAIAANGGRYPISAQCRLLGVARSTYYSMRSRPDRPAAPDPAAPAVVAAHAASKGRYGSRKKKASPGRPGVTVSRRLGLPHHWGRTARSAHAAGRGPRCTPGRSTRPTRRASSRAASAAGRRAPIYAATWPTCASGPRGAAPACSSTPRNRGGIVGHSAGPGKDARPVKPAFATPSFPIPDIEIFHTDRGSEFDNAEIDLMLEALGIERSLSAKGCPHDSAVDESADGIPRAELARRETFGTTRELRAELSDYVHRHDNFRIHSTLGYMSPVEFRKEGLSLPESSK